MVGWPFCHKLFDCKQCVKHFGPYLQRVVDSRDEVKPSSATFGTLVKAYGQENDINSVVRVTQEAALLGVRSYPRQGVTADSSLVYTQLGFLRCFV